MSALSSFSKSIRLSALTRNLNSALLSSHTVSTQRDVQRTSVCRNCCLWQKTSLAPYSQRHTSPAVTNTWHRPTSQQSQTYSTITRDSGVIGRMWQGLGFPGRLKYKKSVLQTAGLRLYLCCAEIIDYDHFFTELELPDTFNSWFRVTELHIWMCMVRLAAEGREGKLVRNSMIRYMWEDVTKRSKKLGGVSSSGRKEGLHILSEQFKGALVTYDEGLCDSDHVLAGALWRQLLEKQTDDPQKLELLVQYIRKQTSALDQQPSGVVLTSGLVQFSPLSGDEDPRRTKLILQEILRRI